jgi:hypothetical protein
MTNKSFLAIIPLLMVAIVSNVYAGGPRLDYPSDSTREGADCWVDGYDAGFAGKYDKDRADECTNEDNEYNRSWDYACRDGGHTQDECNGFKDNPVEIENHESLQQENAQACLNDGRNDGADKPYDKDRAKGCSEYGGQYKGGYKSACQDDNTESSCDLLIQGEKSYCPTHPDIVACVPFLRNESNKQPEPVTLGACGVFGDPRPFVTCPQESNPEEYCLRVNHTAFCKAIGDLCDPGGFVRPEYPYCKGVSE